MGKFSAFFYAIIGQQFLSFFWATNDARCYIGELSSARRASTATLHAAITILTAAVVGRDAPVADAAIPRQMFWENLRLIAELWPHQC